MNTYKKIPFNKPTVLGGEQEYIQAAINNSHLSGDGPFTKKCHEWFESYIGCKKALLTTSCTHAMEIAALLMDIKQGDEIIMPSFAFASTANAFALRGAKLMFIDVNPKTMNIDENKINDAITKRTRAIVPIDYAGVSCNIDAINKIAKKHDLFVLVDSAQSFMSKYKNEFCGSLSPLAAFSFHETKNITSGGEGGLLLINDEKFIEKAEIIREKGTNRSLFLKGKVDKYSWVDLGSSYLPSEINAAYLYFQLLHAKSITETRLEKWNYYISEFKTLAQNSLIELPIKNEKNIHNGHILFLKVENNYERDRLLTFLKSFNIYASFHYIPLHSSVAGKKYGSFIGKETFTTKESQRLIRLPLFHQISIKELDFIIEKIYEYFKDKL